MKANELANMECSELQAKEKELKQELFNLRFQMHTGRLENTAKIGVIRKDIARIKTFISAKKG